MQENIALQNFCQNHNPKTNYSWEQYQEPLEEFLQAFNDYVEIGCFRSKSFHFSNTFVNEILSILIDLTRSVYHWQILITNIFSISLKFGICYILGHRDEFRVNDATIFLHILFWHFLLFFMKNMFIIFSIKFLQQNIS